MIIDKSKSVYTQIAEDFISKIISKEYNNNDMLPPVREQASNYSVTPKTIQNAMKKLEELGLIKKVQGSGIFITVTETQRLQIIEEEVKKIKQCYFNEMKKLGFDKIQSIQKITEERDD